MAGNQDYVKLIDDFEQNVPDFLYNNKLDGTEFVNILLQVINSEKFDETLQLRSLVILQDFSFVFIKTYQQSEDVVSALSKIYKRKDSKWSQFLKSQLLVVSTSLIMSFLPDTLNLETEKLESFILLFGELVQLLLMTNDGRNYLLREVACECLLEMELAFPGLLLSMTDTLRDLCFSENSQIFERYALLFCTALKHQMIHRAEPYSISQKLVAQITNSHHDFQSILTSPPLNSIETKQGLSFLLENLPYVSSTVAVTLVRNCIEITKTNNLMPNSIFKRIAMDYMHTYDVQILHLVLEMMTCFRGELFTNAQESQLMSNLVQLSHLPSLPSSQRLIYFDWLEHFVKNNVFQCKSESVYLMLYPCSWDGWETVTKKLNLLSIITVTFHDECLSLPSSSFWKCLLLSYTSAKHVFDRRAAVTICRGVYLYVKNYETADVLLNVNTLLTLFVKQHPTFTLHILDLVDALKELDPSSEMTNEVKKQLVDAIIKSSVSLDILPHYMRLLNHLVTDSSNTEAGMVSEYLHDIVSVSPLCDDGNWLLGSQILNLCKTLLQTHDTKDYFREIGQVLFKIMTRFDDVDVRDEAKFLYMVLISLSTKKISTLFKPIEEKPALISSVATLDIGSEKLVEIRHLNDPILYLKKCSEQLSMSEQSSQVDDYVIDTDVATIIPKNTLKPYRSLIGSIDFKVTVEICCEIGFCSENIPDFVPYVNDVYCVHIDFLSLSSYSSIEELVLLRLSRNEPQSVTLRFSPSTYKPDLIVGKVMLSILDTSTFTFELEKLHIEFEDYFFPLPVPDAFVSVSKLWRKAVFEDLWTSFLKSSKLGVISSRCQQSVVWINRKADELENVLKSRYQKFMIECERLEDKTTFKVGIFLPTCCHLLLRCECDEDGCVVRIVVDDWRTLPFVNTFVLSLEKDAAL